MAHYLALLDAAPEGGFGVVFPDAPGCTSEGSTLDEAVANGAEALRDWIEVKAEAGEEAPAPRGLDALRSDPKVRAALDEGAVFAAVPLIARRGRTVRAQVTFDEGVLSAIDAAAKRSGETRSGFLARVSLDAITGAQR